MKPRKFNIGDRVTDWRGLNGVVVEVKSITQGAACHHRLKCWIRPFLWSEGRENFFTPSNHELTPEQLEKLDDLRAYGVLVD